MRALSIRQPFVEEILRGIKRIEYRSRSTKIIGERFYIYASAQRPSEDQLIARGSVRFVQAYLTGSMKFPTGVIVGSAVIYKCQQSEVRSQKSKVSGQQSALTADLCPLSSVYEWHLKDVRRLKRHRKPTNMPQPVWFRPF